MTIAAETEMTSTPETTAPDSRQELQPAAESRAEGVDLQGAVAGSIDDSDDDDITIIMLDHNVANDSRNSQAENDAFAWIGSNAPEMEERRRNVLVGELRRVQRASFIHFVLLCLIPTALLIIVIATVVGDEEDCESDATVCSLEPRSFMNAFTTRCVCDAIPVNRED